jgi:outer membrane murein-binding lipoprotein Lpp
MNPIADPLEARLVAGYERQMLLYVQALALLEKQATGPAFDLENIAWTSQLNGLLADVAKIDAEQRPDKLAWESAGRSPGSEMRVALDSIATAIRALANRVDPLIADLRARRDRLVPEMDTFARQRQMIDAYAQAAAPSRRLALAPVDVMDS